MNNLTTMESIWLTMIVWFVLIAVIGTVFLLYVRHRNKTFDERFEKKHKDINDRWVGQIPPVKNPLPPPPKEKTIVLFDEGIIMPRGKINESIRTRKNLEQPKGEYKRNDDGLILWIPTEEKPSSWVSDYVPPLDPPSSYSSDSDSSSNTSDFGGGDFGGEY